ncbi:hypothetical protein LSTR_LSTR008536 [Laodelphax striatellus]|uniref:Uncharacterized protein n=1 Tax=Laodelphax striatellus TaxID=195883 RepID=A0A482WT83_LAOST|nr:hypothetical protein LSTR_LSTR008536 [Laodelphax striatellus]
MKWSGLVLGTSAVTLLLGCMSPGVVAQDGGLELPVQLIGFPVIILAVLLSNFVKKLTYALNPRTYTSRSKRRIDSPWVINAQDVDEVERRIIKELGPDVCIFEEVCERHAWLSQRNSHISWNDLVSKYLQAPLGKKQFYMLSILLGDIIESPELCYRLAEKGRACRSSQRI